MGLHSHGPRDLILALSMLSASVPSAFSQDTTPPAAVRLAGADAPGAKKLSEGDIREQIGALDAKVTVIELILKNHSANDRDLRDWNVRKESILSLSSHASEIVKAGASESERSILGLSLTACNSALELYVKELAAEKQSEQKTSRVNSATSAPPDLIGVYDAAGFEGFKLGAKVLLPMIQEQMAQSQVPADSQRILTNALSRISEARDPRELTRTVDALLSDGTASGDTKRIARDFFSLLARTKPAAPEARVVTVSDSALGWKLAWEKIVAEDKTPRLHPAGKANYEWNCFVSLSKNDDGLKQIKASAELLATHFADKDAALAKSLREIAACTTSEEIVKLDRAAFKNLRTATERFETESKVPAPKTGGLGTR